ncbi:MAG: arginine N-succinyltransferase [Desulfatiglandales bacterium]
MQENNHHLPLKKEKKRFGCLQVVGLMAIAVVITLGVSVFIFRTYFAHSEFKPVKLDASEERVLAKKLENLDAIGSHAASHRKDAPSTPSKSEGSAASNFSLEPEPYSEKGIKREIQFTERELNGLLAKNTDLAKKLAVDLSEGLISAKLLLPVDEDFPVLGGKIIRLRSGLDITYHDGKPLVILKGITIMGVPMPNAWLGGIKNIDLVEKFGGEKGFWKTFFDGIEDIKVEEGLLKIRLKE